MSALGVLLDKDSWLLEIDTDWESGIKEYTWNWDNDEHPPLEEGRKELFDLRTRIAELEVKNERLSNQNFDLRTENERLKAELDKANNTLDYRTNITDPIFEEEVERLKEMLKTANVTIYSNYQMNIGNDPVAYAFLYEYDKYMKEK